MRRSSTVLTALLALLVAGCASADPGPARVAGAFSVAVDHGRWEQACGLLSQQARDGVETGGRTCASALEELRLPGGAPREARVFGDEAQVRLAGDTVFLHRFGDLWRVHAAGCEPRAGLPYRCEIGG
ncbi:hypothetical protein ACIBG8_01555 [Nonomuraea sp. NPDC050556]|uniref:hypothetical protein n=1 Tax=Nonomuraea sp. NPDC050556 TaxID=3364369 RepID=UPI0037B832B2